MASLFAALTAVGAFVRVPIPYVPLTLQTLFVLLAGAALGPVFGAWSQLIYLLVGLAGVPVFANGGGPGYVLQPTFGYLLAYPVAAYVVGYLLRGKNAPPYSRPVPVHKILFSNIAGTLIIFAVGVPVLFFNLNHVVGTPTSLERAVWIGFLVFIPASLIKLTASTLLTNKVSRMLAIKSGRVDLSTNNG